MREVGFLLISRPGGSPWVAGTVCVSPLSPSAWQVSGTSEAWEKSCKGESAPICLIIQLEKLRLHGSNSLL